MLLHVFLTITVYAITNARKSEPMAPQRYFSVEVPAAAAGASELELPTFEALQAEVEQLLEDKRQLDAENHKLKEYKELKLQVEQLRGEKQSLLEENSELHVALGTADRGHTEDHAEHVAEDAPSHAQNEHHVAHESLNASALETASQGIFTFSKGHAHPNLKEVPLLVPLKERNPGKGTPLALQGAFMRMLEAMNSAGTGPDRQSTANAVDYAARKAAGSMTSISLKEGTLDFDDLNSMISAAAHPHCAQAAFRKYCEESDPHNVEIWMANPKEQTVFCLTDLFVSGGRQRDPETGELPHVSVDESGRIYGNFGAPSPSIDKYAQKDEDGNIIRGNATEEFPMGEPILKNDVVQGAFAFRRSSVTYFIIGDPGPGQGFTLYQNFEHRPGQGDVESFSI